MKEDREIEEPCEEDGKPCDFTGSEEWYDENGEMESWDVFCWKCCRWRDWSKEELP
jgi:hypothetical protein